MATMVSGLGGTTGYGENSFNATGVELGNQDDGSINVDISSVFGAGGLNFFGTSYTSIFINTNGTISFDGPELSYTPSGVAGLPDPIIAPFFSDVDIRKGGDILWDIDGATETITITWLNVAPYFGSGTNSFQVQIVSTGNGNFDVQFVYQDIGWTNGGFGTATVGLTDGGTNDIELVGSGDGSIIDDYPTIDFGTGNPDGIYSVSVDNGVPVCFAKGTKILTAEGLIAVEDLKLGMAIKTIDHGYQEVRWIGRKHVATTDANRPIMIKAGALGNDCDVVLSPHHQVLLSDPIFSLMFGSEDVLACASHLVDNKNIVVERRSKSVTYYHLLLDSHEILVANGLLCESLFPGGLTADGAQATARREIELIGADAELLKRKAERVRPALRAAEAALASQLLWSDAPCECLV